MQFRRSPLGTDQVARRLWGRADVHERLARAGSGDVADHCRRVADYRAAVTVFRGAAEAFRAAEG